MNNKANQAKQQHVELLEELVKEITEKVYHSGISYSHKRSAEITLNIINAKIKEIKDDNEYNSILC